MVFTHLTVRYYSGDYDVVSFSELIVGNTYEDGVKIFGGKGNDSISAHESLIAYGDSGAYSIYASGDTVTIDGEYDAMKLLSIQESLQYIAVTSFIMIQSMLRLLRIIQP